MSGTAITNMQHGYSRQCHMALSRQQMGCLSTYWSWPNNIVLDVITITLLETRRPQLTGRQQRRGPAEVYEGSHQADADARSVAGQ